MGGGGGDNSGLLCVWKENFLHTLFFRSTGTCGICSVGSTLVHSVPTPLWGVLRIDKGSQGGCCINA